MTRSTLPCRLDANPDRWFPDSYDSPDAQAVRNLCGGCPVQKACLRKALERVDEHGIFGGLDPDERKAILVKTGRPATRYALGVVHRRALVRRLVAQGLSPTAAAQQAGVALETAMRDLAAA